MTPSTKPKLAVEVRCGAVRPLANSRLVALADLGRRAALALADDTQGPMVVAIAQATQVKKATNMFQERARWV